MTVKLSEIRQKENMSSHYRIATQRIRRAPYQTIAAISIMTMTLFLASAFFLVAAGSQAVLRYFESRPRVNAYFEENIVPTDDQIENLKSKLEATGLIDSVTYTSKEEALKIYQNFNNSEPLLLEAVTANMLPASIGVSSKIPADLKTLADLLKSEPGIKDVRYAEDVVTKLGIWTKSVRVVGVALVGTHILITFIIILLIIGIKVASRRDEIGILQLVGASRGYVSAPFIIEGILYGIIGGLLAWGISYIVLLYSMPFLVTFLAGIPVLPPPAIFMLEVLGGELALGAVIGGFGGALAVSRFLKS
jgi:cell division transport system permease protein